MKKKHFLMMLIISLPLFFTGCVEDMYEDSVSMEDLYRQKAAEFSKKYGVDVTISEDRLAEVIQTKTIEDLETDIQNIAVFAKSLTGNIYEQNIPSSIKKKMKISKKKLRSEYINHSSGSFKGFSGVSAILTIKNKNGNVSAVTLDLYGEVEVSWNYYWNIPSEGLGTVSIDYSCNENDFGFSFIGHDSQSLLGAVVLSEEGMKFDVYGSLTMTSNDCYSFSIPYSIEVNEFMGLRCFRIQNNSPVYGLPKKLER